MNTDGYNRLPVNGKRNEILALCSDRSQGPRARNSYLCRSRIFWSIEVSLLTDTPSRSFHRRLILYVRQDQVRFNFAQVVSLFSRFFKKCLHLSTKKNRIWEAEKRGCFICFLKMTRETINKTTDEITKFSITLLSDPFSKKAQQVIGDWSSLTGVCLS